MANGERCIHCGCQETTHIEGSKDACEEFVSETEHDEFCPIIDCNGDCQTFMALWELAAQREQLRLSRVWFLDGANLVVMDIGT